MRRWGMLGIVGCVGPLPEGPCDDGEVHGVEASLDAADSCAERLDGVRGRVGKQTVGSFVVWSRRTEDELALVVSATHTLGAGWFGATGSEVAEGLAPPPERGVLRLFVPPADGSLSFDELSPLYDLYHPEIPADENTAGLAEIHPRHDVFVGLVDAQRLENTDPFPSPQPIQPGPVPLYDPLGVTTTAPTCAEATPGDSALLVGFPAEGPETGGYSLGRVLDDAEAEAAITELAGAGDEEGSLPYDPEAEVLVAAAATVGMSGGGLFDAEGRWIGTLVRASTTDGVGPYVRAVRATYTVARLDAAYDALTEEERAALTPYLEPR